MPFVDRQRQHVLLFLADRRLWPPGPARRHVKKERQFMDTHVAKPGRLAVLILLLALLASACGQASEEPTLVVAPDQTAPLAGAVEAPTDVAAKAAVEAPTQAAGLEPEARQPSVDPPGEVVKLIFIHHSCGENWLADDDGGLGTALRDNNYFVSDTNYGWGPEAIGDRTDLTDWPEWFRGPNSDTYLDALYTEYGDHSFRYSRGTDPDPGRENEIVLFKSCFPNSNLEGNPDDPPAPGEGMTVGGAKAIYDDLLDYFATRQDKLFVAITAPPVAEGDSSATPANARGFNNWLVNEWLAGYPYNNVAVFDFYNVLTSNGGDPGTNDLGEEGGNHHRWWQGAVQHLQTVDNDLSAYPTGDSHPSQAGNQKATAEFVPLLNLFYHRWQGDVAAVAPVQDTPPPAATAAVARPPATAASTTPRVQLPTELIHPEDLVYVGAFRLPDDAGPPRTFEYGGNAMTFNPEGDPANTDPYPGSLFVMGHDRIAYGELPDGNQVAEVSIPVPAIADNPADLPQAAFIQGFHDVTAGYFTELEEIPKVGMQYLNHPATGAKIHLVWGQHLQPPDEPSHAWFNPTLAAPDLQGVWFIGDQDLYSTSGYLFEIPTSWADAYTEGRYLATGRMRDGGQGGMGPALFAYRPWLPDGSAPPSGTHLEEITLLLYENAYNTAEFVRCLEGYQYPDEWEGGTWITTPSGKSAVLFAGTKSMGTKMWYGFINPLGPEYACVDQHVTDFDTCRMADGSSCPAEDYTGCCDDEQGNCVTYRGWWSTRFDAQFILYDPADLAQVATGTMESWEPQPYASMDIDEHLFLSPPEWDLVTVGWGDQRRNRIGPTAYDRNSNFLYVVEQYGEGAKPVVHVWRVGE
jgi:hypothetical protein